MRMSSNPPEEARINCRLLNFKMDNDLTEDVWPEMTANVCNCLPLTIQHSMI